MFLKLDNSGRPSFGFNPTRFGEHNPKPQIKPDIEKTLEDAAAQYGVPIEMIRAEVFRNISADAGGVYRRDFAKEINAAASFLRVQLKSKEKNSLEPNQTRHIYVGVLEIKPDVAGVQTATNTQKESSENYTMNLVAMLAAKKRTRDSMEFIVPDEKSRIAARIVDFVRKENRDNSRLGKLERLSVRFNNILLSDVVIVSVLIPISGYPNPRSELLEGVFEGAPWMRNRRVMLTFADSGCRYIYANKMWKLAAIG